MYIAMLLLVPGLISAAIYGRAKGIPLKSVDFLLHWMVAAFLVNAFVIGVDVLRGHGAAPLSSLFSTVLLLSKYGGLALVTSVALPYAALLVDDLLRKAGRHG